MYCTTQCDWSSGSWLKGTITPAVIKGQKEHHQQLTKKIRSHIKSHPDDFAQGAGDDADAGEDDAGEEGELADGNGGDTVTTQDKDLAAHLKEITEDPVMLGVVGLCVLLLLTLLYQWSSNKETKIIVVAPTIKKDAAY